MMQKLNNLGIVPIVQNASHNNRIAFDYPRTKDIRGLKSDGTS